jgi:hypothetical protein
MGLFDLFKSNEGRIQQTFFFIAKCDKYLLGHYNANQRTDNYSIEDIRNQYVNNFILGMGYQPSGLKPKETTIRSEDFYDAIVIHMQNWVSGISFKSGTELGWEEKLYAMGLIKKYLKSNYSARLINFIDLETSPQNNYVVIKVSAMINAEEKS